MGSYELLIQSRINKSIPIDSTQRYEVNFSTENFLYPDILENIMLVTQMVK